MLTGSPEGLDKNRKETNSTRCSAFHRGPGCRRSLPQARGCAASKAEREERWLSHHSFLFSPFCDGAMQAGQPAPLVGHLAAPGCRAVRESVEQQRAAGHRVGSRSPRLPSAWAVWVPWVSHAVSMWHTLLCKHMSHSQGKLPLLGLVRGKEGSQIHSQHINLLGKILKMGILHQFGVPG